ncbi:hypothetical protein SLS53_004549 [Cytospora paraplurivora]|uniref:Major facilitator superfamily (MFS) profile domain-containing protein n=1 Tax=Cytospora paraplurivora TaxID=2898453 RepID=A0AAN9YHC4_9PEZI
MPLAPAHVFRRLGEGDDEYFEKDNKHASQAQAERQSVDVKLPRLEYVVWYKEPHLRRLYAMSLVLMIASATTGYDCMLVNTSQQLQQWHDFFVPEVNDNNKLGILINMFNIGSVCSFFITPYIADHFGRKVAIIIGFYVSGRFLLGFGNSLAQMASPLLLTEICHPQHRGPVTAIYNCLWNVGALLVTSVGWGTAYISNDWSWRSITLLQIVPSVIQITFIWWLPESPRYLVNKDRNDEALLVLAGHHAGGNIQSAVVQYEYQEIKQTIQMDRNADRATTYLDFLRTKGNRWRLAIIVSLGIISQYSGNALFSNYINIIYEAAGITQQNKKLAMSTGKTILDMIATIAAAVHVDCFGRRPLFLLSVSGMMVAFACWTATGAIYENSGMTSIQSGYAQLVFIWIFGIFYDIGFSGLLVAYALEILPFHLRAKGMMIMNMTVQAVLAIGKFVSLFSLLIVELMFVWYFYIETKGPTLEETARIFDGDDAVNHVDLHEIAKEIEGDFYEEAHFAAYRNRTGPTARDRYYS